MTEEDAFLLEILSRPDDEVPRLIYCDWLEDHDDPRAEWNRLGWALRDSPPMARGRAALAEQVEHGCRDNGWVYHDGLVLTWDQLLLVFRIRLAETMAYCAGQPADPLRPPAEHLRSQLLDPRILLGLMDNLTWPAGVDWPGLLVDVALTRRRLLDRNGQAPSRMASTLRGGRLIYFDTSVPVWRTGSRQASNGYFDDHEMPPWDTWVMHVPEEPGFRPYQIAWVSRDHLQRTRWGIEVHDGERIGWIEDHPSPFVKRLRAAGLMNA